MVEKEAVGIRCWTLWVGGWVVWEEKRRTWILSCGSSAQVVRPSDETDVFVVDHL